MVENDIVSVLKAARAGKIDLTEISRHTNLNSTSAIRKNGPDTEVVTLLLPKKKEQVV